MKLKRTISVAFVISVVCTPLLGEPIVRQPAELVRGDRYRLAFVTSDVTAATNSDIEYYNSFVQTLADEAPTVGQWGLEWNAIVSTEDVNARDNTGTNWEIETGVPIFLIDGNKLGENNRDFFSGDTDPRPFFNFTEKGDRVVWPPDGVWPEPNANPDLDESLNVWTGTRFNGQSGKELGTGFSATGGWTRDSPYIWFTGPALTNGSQLPTVELHLYALSEELVAVPEPSTRFMLGAFVCLLTARSRLRPNRKNI